MQGHEDLPDVMLPNVQQQFERLCPSWEEYWGARFPGEVGTSPVEQIVHHESEEPPAKRARL
eukprot:6472218-Amphidinium_carterae.1